MIPIVLALILQVLGTVSHAPARLLSVVEPAPPLNTIEGNCVLSEITVDPQGKVGQIAVFEGKNPFSDAANRATRQWTFQAAKSNDRAVESKVGVLTVFRPAAIGNFAVGGPALGFTEPMPGQGNHPPLPIAIADPGYPPTTTAMGVVVLELSIDSSGNPSAIRTVRDVPTLTDAARDAIRSWKFMPAMESGQPIDGSLIVVLSFLRPVLAIP